MFGMGNGTEAVEGGDAVPPSRDVVEKCPQAKTQSKNVGEASKGG